MKINMRPGKIAVHQEGSSKKNQGAFIVLPDTLDCMGVIKFIADDVAAATELKVGTKVIFGDSRQQIRMDGKDIQIMELGNIVATIQEE